MKPTPFESKELNIFNGGLGMVVSAYNPRSWKVVAGRSRVQGYLRLQREFWVSLGYVSCLQEENEEEEEGELWRDGSQVKSIYYSC